MKKRFKALINRLKKNIKSPEMKVLPGQLAFFFVLILIPLIALTLSICSNFNISDSFLRMLKRADFPDAIVFLIGLISNSKVAGFNLIFYISALILASNGTYSIICVSNQIYKIKNKGYFYDRLKSVAMLLVLIVIFLFVAIVPILGHSIIKTISIAINSDAISDYVRTMYGLLNVPLSWIFIFVGIKLIYIMAPDAKIPSKKVNYGALFTSFSWVLFTKLYSLYISVSNSFNSVYGSISSVIVLMWWIYFLSYFFVMGMALNVCKYEEKRS